MTYLKLLRPQQWTKNFFIFAPIFFSKNYFNLSNFVLSIYAFILFSLAASIVYIVNDIMDREQDAKHPTKKGRPLASGQISITEALVILVCLLSFLLLGIYFYLPQIGLIITFYLGINLAYSLFLKHVFILDILIVSSLYVLRVLTGGLATNILVSNWLILCTIFLALFLTLAKRKAETNHMHQRKVLTFYSPVLIDHLLTISVTLTLISYSLYTILALNSSLALYSIFFVLLAIFRYFDATYRSSVCEYPEKLILSDKTILFSIIGWVTFMYIIIHYAHPLPPYKIF